MSEKMIITIEDVEYYLVGAGFPKNGEKYLDPDDHSKVLTAFMMPTVTNLSQIIVKPVKWKPEVGKDVYVIYVGSGRILKKMFTREHIDFFESGLVRQTYEEAKDLLENLQQTIKEFDV